MSLTAACRCCMLNVSKNRFALLGVGALLNWGGATSQLRLCFSARDQSVALDLRRGRKVLHLTVGKEVCTTYGFNPKRPRAVD